MDQPQNSSVQKKRFCWLAIASTLLAIVGFAIIFFYIKIIISPWILKLFCIITASSLGLIGFVFGILGLYKITRSKGTLKGTTLVVAGVISNFLIIFGFLGIPTGCNAYGMVCGSNLCQLGKAMLLYENKYDQFPDPNQWCDLLLKDGNVKPQNFVCPTAVRQKFVGYIWPFKDKIILQSSFRRKGKWSTYAMNPNCKPNSTNDTVLLFETSPGWNQHGGKELVTKDNHNGDGANILMLEDGCEFDKYPEGCNWGDTQGISKKTEEEKDKF